MLNDKHTDMETSEIKQLENFYKEQGFNVIIEDDEDDVKYFTRMLVKRSGDLAGIHFFVDGKPIEGKKLDQLQNKVIA